jgi:DNA repair exonuclease SbcCD nuclease subunit
MKLGVYTDPHLGLSLKSNTTLASRQRMSDNIFTSLEHTIKQMKETHGVGVIACVGDFFHNYTNSESTIMRSFNLAESTDLILGGNHDVVNDSDKVGSLNLIADVMKDYIEVIEPVFDEVTVVVKQFLDVSLVFVPHHSGQELFESALDVACKKAEDGVGKPHIIFLHCNYECDFAKQDTALNLTKERAEKLLQHFDLVVVGHDHTHKTFFDGKLVILGSHQPTNFGDCDTDKYYMVIDVEGNSVEYTLHKTYVADNRYMEVDWKELTGYLAGIQDMEAVRFLRVKGLVPAEKVTAYAKEIKSAWAALPNLYALKSDVSIGNGTMDGVVVDRKTIKLSDMVRQGLKDFPAMLDLFEELKDVEEA